jgi:hypothetical protein
MPANDTLDMRIHHALASAAIASTAVLTAVAGPADAGATHPQVPTKFAIQAAVRAAGDCTIKPNSVNLYTAPRDVTFSVPGATEEWLIVDDTDELVLAAANAPSLGDEISPTWTFDPTFYTNSQAGKVTIDVFTAPNLNTTEEPDFCQAQFSFKRGAKISAALKVSKGYRTLSGKVQSASWGAKPKYVTVKAGIVDVQKKINGAWVTKKSVKTTTTGTYSAKIKAAKGDWRAVFKGTSKIGSRTSATKNG